MKKQNLSQPSICWQQPCLAPSCRPCRRGVALNTSSSSNRKSTRKLGCNIILQLNCRMKWINLRGTGGILHCHHVFVRSSALNVQLVNSFLRAANFMQQLPFGHADPCCSDCQRQGIWLQVLWISEVPHLLRSQSGPVRSKNKPHAVETPRIPCSSTVCTLFVWIALLALVLLHKSS